MDDMPRLAQLTPDDRVWRLDWFGEIEYPGRVRQYNQPCIKVALSPLLGSPDLFGQSGSFSTEINQQHCQWVSVGALFMLRIGDLWQHGRLLKAPTYSSETFRLKISPDTTRFVKAGFAIEEHHLLPFAEHRWHQKFTKSSCVSVHISDDQQLIIPGAEMIRFYYGSSSNFLKKLVTGPLHEETLWQKKTYDGDSYHLHLKLAPGLSGASATDIGRIALDPEAQRSATNIYAHILQATADREAAFLYTSFPFRGETTLAVTGMWLSFGDRPKSTFLAFYLRSCSHAFPFGSLTYETSDRYASRPHADTRNSERTEAKWGQNPKAKSRATIDHGDPGAGKRARHVYANQNVRFPDLQLKSVWRERLVAMGATEILIKRDDGTVEKLAFGEPHGSGDTRAIDISGGAPRAKVAEIADEQLPHFVRAGIVLALKQRPNRSTPACARPLLPSGRVEPVFMLPLVVDADGVVDTSLMYTGPDGAQRLKRICFIGIFEGERETKKLAILEGKNYRSSPVAIGVQSTDLIELIPLL